MEAFGSVYARLRTVMLDNAPGQVVAKDDAGDLVVRTAAVDPKTGQPGWFGTVTIKKSYVAYHLIPVSYTHLRAHENRQDLVCRLLLEKKTLILYFLLFLIT